MLFKKIETNSLQESLIGEQYEVIGGLLNEKYFGKLPPLLEAEKLFDSVVNDVRVLKKMPNETEVYAKIEKVEEILKNLFNFSEVVIDTGHFSTGLAFTIPNNTVLDYIYETEVTENGYRYKKPYFPCVIRLDSDIFSLAENGAEVLGVVLHEIGHNFYYMPLLGRSVYSMYIIQAVLFKYTLYVKNKVQFSVMRPLLKILEDSTGFLGKSYDWLNTLFSNISMRKDNLQFRKFINFIVMFYNPLQATARIIIAAAEGVLGLFVTAGTGYSNEKFADEFATVYGYGADMNKFLLRYNVPEGDKENNVFQAIGETAATALMVPILLVDVHPSIGYRLTIAEQRLKKELTNTTNPKYKKLIQLDIIKVQTAKKSFDRYAKEKKILDIEFLDKYIKDPVFNRGKDNIEEFDNPSKRSTLHKII